MSIYPLKTFDTFSRSDADTWGSTDNGQTWNSDSETYWDTDGTVGKITVSSTTFPTYDLAWINLANYGGNQSTAQVLALARWTGSQTYPTTDHGPVLSYNGSNTFYFVRIQNNYNEVAIACYVNGVMYEIDRVDKVINKNVWYWIRFERHAGGLRVKIWQKGSTEPSSWTLSTAVFAGSNPPGAGSWGWTARRTPDTHTIELDAFYGFTMEDDTVDTSPVIDIFERDVDAGWGISDAGQVWEGHMSVDPAIITLGGNGLAELSGEGYGQVTLPGDDFTAAIIGPSQSGNRETFAKFAINSSAGSTHAVIGLRGAMQVSGGAAQFTGYFCRVTSGGTQLTLYKITSFGGALTAITPSSTLAHTALTANTIYFVRFQVIGTTLQARIWADGAGEPGTWNVVATDSSLTSGRLWLGGYQNSGTSTERNVKFYNVEYDAPTVATTLHTTTGALTSTAITDTSLALRASFTNDTDSDNSVTVQYKKTIDAAWTTFGGTKTRNASPLSWTFTLPSLEQNTSYDVRVTFADPDTVKGTNPVNATFVTTNTGVYTGVVSVANVGANALDVNATYTGDTNDNSTATLEYRLSTYEQNPINDTFFGGSGTLLQDHAPDVGGPWVRHTANVATTNFELWQGRVYSRSNSTNGVFYYVNTVLPTEYEVSGDFVVNAKNVRVGLSGRMSNSADTAYFARYVPDAGTIQLGRLSAGSVITLATYNYDPNVGDHFSLKLVIKDAYKAVELNGIEILRSTDNTITAAGYAGIRFSPLTTAEGSPTNQVTIDNFNVTYRTTSPSWTSSGAMTANRGTKTFTKNVSGLTSDAVYEFRVTYADANGLQGINPIHIVTQTIGQAIAVQNIGAITQATSLVVEVAYLYDTNNNSSMAIQYRSVMDHLWTTVPATQIAVNRGTKIFKTTIVSLKPNSTYEVKAIPSDPNGILEDTPLELSALFTTTGFVFESEQQGKHYLWKVYDPENQYVTTWQDAGEPEFAWHENGGVSDLAVTLPRRISDIQNTKSGIAHQNRVDVWCLDPSSDGFGLNLSNDPEFDLGAWTLESNASIDPTGGPDGGNALKITTAVTTQLITRERAIYLFRQLEEYNTSAQQVRESTQPYPVPLVITGIAKARGSKLVLFAEAYDQNDVKLDQSDDFAETVGTDWQNLRFEYTPPAGTHYIRICAQNDGKGTMWLDKVAVRPKEVLIYRGRIESYTPLIDQTKEEIEVQILGLVSLLSDDYIEFLQFVSVQPENDLTQGRENLGPADPSDMLKIIIDTANAQNPHFALYYTAESIRATGRIMEYTFRDQQVRACFDKVRSLCPPGWHYYVEPDGLVNLRGPEHAAEHKLRLGVEIMNFSVEKSIRNLKNFVHVKGRQDEDNSEPDGHGSIHYIAFDQESIDKYGKRMLFIRDSNITDPDTAELVGEGRLEEYNREEQRGQANIPDEKSIEYVGGALRGYNIESFRPGDNVLILDPVAGPKNTYWDAMVWDVDTWDSSNAFAPLPETVPIKTFQFQGTFGTLELSERPPASTQEFGRLYRWLQLKDSDEG